MQLRLCMLFAGLAAIALFGAARPLAAQDQEPAAPESKERVDSESGKMKIKPENDTPPIDNSQKMRMSQILTDFAQDQKDIWTSPTQLRFSDTSWLVPTAGLTAGLFVTDAQYSRHLSTNPSTLQHYSTLSNVGIGGLVGGAAAMWLLSHRTHTEHWRETGLLAGEAAIHSLIVSESLKYTLRRDRPEQGNGNGAFFHGGTSFPSEHAAAAWSIAGVIAHEYPGPLTKVLVYGAASLISYSRVHAKQHFPSDVVVGSLLGELSAHEIYKRHHDPELDGIDWETSSDRARDRWNTPSGANLGSPYVPLDSWVYPAFERLIGLGIINSGFLGSRPWTRRECARLLSEAEDHIEGQAIAADIYNHLAEEFRPELAPPSSAPQAQMESIYTRVTNISGAPIQGYDFAQTLINDYGRPYQQGVNAVSGFSFWTTAGPWVGYVRGEYEYSPSAPALPFSARQFIGVSQFLGPTQPYPDVPYATVSQFKLLDAYVGLNFSNWQISFGQQSLWWGPAEGGPMLFSNNAAPISMLRLDRVTPLTIPFISKFLGPMRINVFIGQLSGQNFVNGPTGVIGNYLTPLSDQPYINGQKISFKPTANFEFGITRTALIGGYGVPLTWATIQHSLIDSGSAPPGTLQDPGDRRSGVDWTYRLPKLRRWLTFYGDAFTDDEISPIAYWDRSAISAGLFLAQVPKLRKLDFRVEGVFTDVPAGGRLSHGFYYFNARFLSGYTNDRNLIGSWIGREGQGAQAWTNYWFTPRTRLQLNFRHQKVSQQFIPGGGTLTDFGALTDFTLKPGLSLNVSLQHERWLFPVIQPGITRNVTASVGVTFEPRKLLRFGKSSVAPGGLSGDQP